MFDHEIDLEGILFDHEQNKERWPKFWTSHNGRYLTGLAFCEWTKLESGVKLVNYMDFIEAYYPLFEFELGPKKYNILTFAQKQYRRDTEEAIKRVMSAKPCRPEDDPISKYR